jgi:hypothetical protein
MNLIQGFVRNVGSCRLDVKGRNASGSPIGMRVPKRSTGADHPVVELKAL